MKLIIFLSSYHLFHSHQILSCIIVNFVFSLQVPSLKKPNVTAEDNVGVQSVAIADDWTNVLSSDATELYGRLEAALKQQIKVARFSCFLEMLYDSFVILKFWQTRCSLLN